MTFKKINQLRSRYEKSKQEWKVANDYLKETFKDSELGTKVIFKDFVVSHTTKQQKVSIHLKTLENKLGELMTKSMFPELYNTVETVTIRKKPANFDESKLDSDLIVKYAAL